MMVVWVGILSAFGKHYRLKAGSGSQKTTIKIANYWLMKR